mmetsp:Transcript_7178/g.14120  ORF Transcript_7178/g.14120 Transcript_7178/m.14120 type:complete len:342 (+) Transcript_7178:138-1163(+)
MDPKNAAKSFAFFLPTMSSEAARHAIAACICSTLFSLNLSISEKKRARAIASTPLRFPRTSCSSLAMASLRLSLLPPNEKTPLDTGLSPSPDTSFSAFFAFNALSLLSRSRMAASLILIKDLNASTCCCRKQRAAYTTDSMMVGSKLRILDHPCSLSWLHWSSFIISGPALLGYSNLFTCANSASVLPHSENTLESASMLARLAVARSDKSFVEATSFLRWPSRYSSWWMKSINTRCPLCGIVAERSASRHLIAPAEVSEKRSGIAVAVLADSNSVSFWTLKKARTEGSPLTYGICTRFSRKMPSILMRCFTSPLVLGEPLPVDWYALGGREGSSMPMYRF